MPIPVQAPPERSAIQPDVLCFPSDVPSPSRYYALLDVIRGVVLLSMIVYHAMWDIVNILHYPLVWYSGMGAFVWQQSICWTFILLSGFCWTLGRRPLRRGLTVLGASVLISVVTRIVMPSSRILFGVLNLIGVGMLLLIPADKLLRRLPPALGVAGSVFLFALTRNVQYGHLGFGTWKLVDMPPALYQNLFFAFWGFPPEGFYSSDYFPIFPWIFLFLAGYFLARLLNIHTKNWRLLSFDCPPLRFLGRHSLVIYLLHQPLLYGIFMVLQMSGIA